MHEHDFTLLTNLRNSGTPWSLLRVASISRSSISQEQIRLGQLGCSGVDATGWRDRVISPSYVDY